jgi:hypothetical protein
MLEVTRSNFQKDGTLSTQPAASWGVDEWQTTQASPNYVASFVPKQPQNDSQINEVTGNNTTTNYTAPSYSQDDMNYLDYQLSRLNSQYGRTDSTLSQGLERILQSYNDSKNDANQQQSRFLQDILTNREDTGRAKDNAIGRVDTNARTLAESLRRRLGMAGGSDSSAYKIAAPGAVARQASGERGDVMETYGVNFRNLDTREKRGKEDFAELISDLAKQREMKTQDFKGGITDERNRIDEARAEVARQKALLQGGGWDQARAAMSPYVAQMDARTAALDKLLGNIAPVKVGAIDTSIPELRKYMVDRAAINANTQSGTQDPYAPYRQNLQKDEEERLTV